MKEIRPKGFINFYDRKICEECVFMEWVGTGSIKQQATYCTKVEPHFMVFLEDCCDEHINMNDKKEIRKLKLNKIK
jgi:hypothetical protein